MRSINTMPLMRLDGIIPVECYADLSEEDLEVLPT